MARITGRELASIHREVGSSAEVFAGLLGIEPADLESLEHSVAPVSRLISAKALWLHENHRQLKALEDSGLPECEWVAALDSTVDGIEDDTAEDLLDLLEDHDRSCETCLARTNFIEERFPNNKPYPMGGVFGAVVKALSYLDRFALLDLRDDERGLRRLSRNVILGSLGGAAFAAMLLAIPALFGVLLAVVQLVTGPPIQPSELIEIVLFAMFYIASGAAAGAAGGLVWDVASGRLGSLLVGVVSMSVFVWFMILSQEGDPLTWEQFDWIVWVGLSLVFGIALGWGLGKGSS